MRTVKCNIISTQRERKIGRYKEADGMKTGLPYLKGMLIFITKLISSKICFLQLFQQAFWRSKMGRKDASTIKLPVDQYRKQIGKQDYKKTKPILRATKLKAEAKKTAIGIKNLLLRSRNTAFFLLLIADFDQALPCDTEVGLVLAAILALLLAFYAFFYLRLSTDVDPDLERDED
uniref:Triple QxxK/R motif-containing protein n=1 Tax=Canis lupus familiaris TaxID=9615 RepID=A0A8C0TBK5_CANLF